MAYRESRISAKKNDLDISNDTFKRITNRDLKWYPYKMYARKERNIYK